MKFEELNILLKLLFPECIMQSTPDRIISCYDNVAMFDLFLVNLKNPKRLELYIYNGNVRDVTTRLGAAFKVVKVRTLKYYLEPKEE